MITCRWSLRAAIKSCRLDMQNNTFVQRSHGMEFINQHRRVTHCACMQPRTLQAFNTKEDEKQRI